nr:hypothetical protein [Oscillospiraceae bacterium]
MLRRLASGFAGCLGGQLDYIGMGSLFFEDFKEFHSSGCIDRMTSIEYMLDSEGQFDELKYRRFQMNRPFDAIEILPVSVAEAVDALSFDRHFLTWFDYDAMITRETIEETAAVIRKATTSGMLVSSTGMKIAYSYIGENRTLNLELIRDVFGDMFDGNGDAFFDALKWDNFTENIRDSVTPYYERLVAEKNIRENRNFRLCKAGRITYNQPALFVSDIWLLVDMDEVKMDAIEEKVLRTPDAGEHFIVMPVLTDREKTIIGSRLGDDPGVLAQELAIDEDSIRKYIRYWDDFILADGIRFR